MDGEHPKVHRVDVPPRSLWRKEGRDATADLTSWHRAYPTIRSRVGQ